MAPVPVVDQYEAMTEKQITAIVNDRITRVTLLANDDVKASALDFNARLVTALRVRGIWPGRYTRVRA
jgi:hypothetical protein